MLLTLLWTPVLSEDVTDSGLRKGIVLGIHLTHSRFDEGLGFSPSTGVGGSVSFHPFAPMTFGVSITRSSTETLYDAVGSTSALSTSVLQGEVWVRHPLWTPGEMFSVLAEGGAGLAFLSTEAQVISFGALGAHTLPSRNETRPVVLAGIPLQLHAGTMLDVEMIPTVTWVLGPSGPFTDYSVRGGLGIAIY